MSKLKRCKWCSPAHYMIVIGDVEMEISQDDADALIAKGTPVTDGMCTAASEDVLAQGEVR